MRWFFFEWIYQHVHLFVYFCNQFKVFKHSCFFLSDKNRAPYFILEEIDIMRTGYATYYTLVLFDYRRLQNRTLQLDFLVIFCELYDFLSCYIWYFFKEFKYTHQHFQKVEFKSAYKKNRKNIYKSTETVVFFIIVIINYYY